MDIGQCLVYIFNLNLSGRGAWQMMSGRGAQIFAFSLGSCVVGG